MPLKDYQQAVVDDFERWHDMLKKDRERMVNAQDDIKKAQEAGLSKEVIEDMRSKARLDLPGIWHRFKNEEWKERSDHAGNPIPHVCIRVPTGGGKTRIAAAILQKTRKTRGLVIWMIPTKAIEEQTTNILKDKEHAIRQMLDTHSGNRVMIVRKDSRISKYDLKDNLCIMPLMMQSTNRRKNKDFLRMNKSNGHYAGFFPPADDARKRKEFNKRYPGLDMREGDADIPETSLKNVVRMCRPIIILDEAHKASARNFGEWAKYVNDLGPSMVIELTATPNEEYSNILRTVTGKELLDESMIKKSIVLAKSAPNWHLTLNNAVKRLKELEKRARRQSAKHIRPIMVIRVELTDPKLYEPNERTRTGAKTHAIDAQNYLTDKLGIPRDQIAIKSSATDELRGQNLMERGSPVRYIITKNALMEGWDCPFAYMLVILDNLQSQTALTQLLGRIMRQPHIAYTGDKSLDNCYVYCMYEDVERVITLIQKQLHDEGFGSMRGYVQHAAEATRERRTNKRRTKFQELEIHLPMVSHKDDDGWTDIDYEKHIVSNIPWDDIAISPPENTEDLERRMNDGVVIDIVTVRGRELFAEDEHTDGSARDTAPSLSEWAAAVSDLVPNAWNASRIIQNFWRGIPGHLVKANEKDLQSIFIERLKTEIVSRAESIFREKIENRTIQFDMQVPSTIFKMHDTYEITPDEGEESLLEKRERGESVQLSLFEPVYKEDFTTDPERRFAQYLDEAEAIEWWHRIAARNRSEYYLRGWKKDKIYPDFIAVFNKDDKRVLRIYETKGMHLGTNEDTEYKRKVLKLLGETLTAGKLTITGNRILEGEFMIVLEGDIDNRVKTRIAKGPPARPTSLKLR